MEPERQIEKLLRAYAKKRRTGESDAFKLRPWVRRRLQDEVSKQFADTDEESLSLWQLFRQQWAVLVGFALFIFLGASLFLPALSSAKHQAQSAVAMSHLRQIGVAAQMAAAENNGRLPLTLNALTNGYLGGDTLTDPASGKPFIYVAAGEQLDELQTNSVLAYSMETGKRRAVLFADGSVQRMNDQTFAALNPRPAQTETSLAELAANAPAPAAMPPTMPAAGPTVTNALIGHIAMARLAVAEPTTQKTGQFFENRAVAGTATGTFAFRTANGAQDLNQTKAKAQVAPSVLASFELRQNGNDVVIVDHDGSIYKGSIITAAAMGQGEGGGASGQQSGQNIPFQVNGLNLSLNKNVVFLGDVISISNNVETNTVTNLALPANPRIVGTATIGSTNTIQIDAVPVTP